MSQKVVYLHGEPAPIGQYVRIGVSGHRQLEILLGSGRMPADHDKAVSQMLARTTTRLDRMREVLGDLYRTIRNVGRSETPRRRHDGHDVDWLRGQH